MEKSPGPPIPPVQLVLEFEPEVGPTIPVVRLPSIADLIRQQSPASSSSGATPSFDPSIDEAPSDETNVEKFEPKELEFLEALVQFNAQALWANSPKSADAAKWFYNGGHTAPGNFLKICRVLDADPRVIIREVMVEFHRQQLLRIVAREPRWQEIASWYAEQSQGYFPIDWLVRASTIPKSVLQQDAHLATARCEDEIDSAEFGFVQCMAA